MNLDTVITKQQGIEAMQYIVANLLDNDKFMDYLVCYVFTNYVKGFTKNLPITDGIRIIINMWLRLPEWIQKENPTYLPNENDYLKLEKQFHRTYKTKRTLLVDNLDELYEEAFPN